MRTRLLAALALVASAPIALRSAAAQTPGPAVQSARNTIELGLDAQLLAGLGADSYVNLTVPAARARVGFFLNNDSRWSVEPAVGFAYNRFEGGGSATAYDLELGALYHLRPASTIVNVTGATVGYVRPFVNFAGASGSGQTDNRFSFGAGVGLKRRFRSSLAFRGEANIGYDAANSAARLGVLAGISYFMRRGN